MKLIILAILITSFLPISSNPKITKIDKFVPLYIKVRSLEANKDDDLSLALKRYLSIYGFKFVTKEKFSELQKQYSEDIRFATSSEIHGQIPSIETIDRIYRSGTPSQSLTLIYKGLNGDLDTYNNCDSIGFSIFKLPYKTNRSPIETYMYSIKDKASNHPDSLATFLISKL